MPEGYDVFLSRTAVKAAQGIPSAQQEKLGRAFSVMKENPFSFPYKKIRGEPHLYRIRVGNFRVLYEIDEPNHRIMVLKIDRRSRVYK
jgi:mRNA interferase RelE/StbE